jgi:hypothetical protein
MFPTIEGEIKQLDKDITLNALSLLNFDPCTKQCEQEVQKILRLQDIANQLPNAFTDSKRVTKSHISLVNASAQTEVPVGQSTKIIANESIECQKRGRPIGSKDKNPQKIKGANNKIGIIEKENIHEETDIIDHKTS